MIKTILVAFDGSDQSRKAFDLGLEMAVNFQAKLLAVGVVRLPEPAASVEIDAMLDRGKLHFEEEFVTLRERAGAARVEFEARVAVGHPAEHIVREAEDSQADNIIIMGRRGTTRVGRVRQGHHSTPADCARPQT